MAKTLKDLILALLNATLILLAVCLFLGWKLATTVDGITTKFAENLQLVAPLREEAQGIRGELTALRSSLNTLSSGDGALDTTETQRINALIDKLDGIEQRFATTQTRLGELADSPETLINHAIDKTADTVTDRITAIRGCVPET